MERRDMTQLPIILIAGPTGVGKTALSLELAERLRTDIVNADSRSRAVKQCAGR